MLSPESAADRERRERDVDTAPGSGARKRRKRRRGGSGSGSVAASSVAITRKAETHERHEPAEPDVDRDDEPLVISSCQMLCGADSSHVDPVEVLLAPQLPVQRLPRIRFGRDKFTRPHRYVHRVPKSQKVCWYCERTYMCRYSHKGKFKCRKTFRSTLSTDNALLDEFLAERRALIESRVGGSKKNKISVKDIGVFFMRSALRIPPGLSFFNS